MPRARRDPQNPEPDEPVARRTRKRRNAEPHDAADAAPEVQEPEPQKARRSGINAKLLKPKAGDESLDALCKACFTSMSAEQRNAFMGTLSALGPELRGFSLCSGSEIFSVVCKVILEARKHVA